MSNFGSEYIASSNATFSNKILTLFSANFAFHILWISMFIQEMKIAEEKKKKFNKTFNAADDRRLAANKARPISIEFATSFAMRYG